MIDERTIYKLAVDAGLSYFADDIVKLIKPAIGIRLRRTYESAVENGTSKFGGLPHLPTSISWPTFKGIPLSFLAQINLSEATVFDIENMLPKTGILYFFSDVWQNSDFNNPETWRVIYYEGNVSSVSSTPAPDNLAPEALYEACSVEYRHELTIPYGDLDGTRQLRQLGFTEKDEEQYFWEVYGKLYGIYRDEDYPSFCHHILGWHDTVQTDLQEGSEIYSQGLSLPLQTEIEDSRLDAWRLLLQIGADDNLNDYFERYYMIREDDLSTNDFNKVWYIAQSD